MQNNHWMYYQINACQYGFMLVAARSNQVCAVFLGREPAQLVRELADRFPQAHLVTDVAQTGTFFKPVFTWLSQRRSAIPFAFEMNGTVFQKTVWRALMQIPFGETRSYSGLAEQLCHPKAVRAVAHACAMNPLALIVPCHRVIYKNGQLSHYRWGSEIKQALLDDERQSLVSVSLDEVTAD